MVAPGRTHAIAGVIAHSMAIVSSANPRVLVIFMIVLLPLTTRNNDTPSNYNLSSPLTMAAVTVITALRLTETTNPSHPMKPIERLGEPSLRKNTLTLECIPGLILLMVQTKGLRSGTLAKAADVSPDTIDTLKSSVFSLERRGQSLATASIPRARWRESLWCRGRFESASL